MRNGTVFLSLITLGIGACTGGTGGGSSWSGSVADSAGIPIVSNPLTGTWGSTSTWQLQEQLRIGSSGGDPDYQFGQIVGITVGTDGDIFVLDQQAAQVRVFDGTGTFERTMGRPGGGPGEIHAQGASALLHGPGDTLFVVDMGNARVQRYLEDGTDIGSYRLEFSQGIPVRWDIYSDGTIVSQLRKFNAPNQPVTDTMDVIVSFNTDGSIRDTLMTMPSGKTYTTRGGAPEFNFFTAEPAWTLARSGGVWFGVSDTYRIGLYEGGELTRVLTKPFERTPIGEDDESVVTQTVERLWMEAGVPPQAVTQLKSAINYAEYFPAYFQLTSGPFGTLWVQHLRVPSELDEDERASFNPLLSLGAADWDIFDPEGRFLGALTMPDRFQPIRFVEDRIYGVWRDELDVQHVLALRVVGPGGGEVSGIPVGGQD